MRAKFFYTSGLMLVLLVSACGSLHTFKKELQKAEKKGVFQNQFTGLMVFDPEKKDTLIYHHAEKYFIPASNTKIFTLYMGLQMLPDSVPTLRYFAQNDTLYVQPTGDPLWLNPNLPDSTALMFMRQYQKIYLLQRPMADDPKGFGWAWEDFDSYYAPERSPMPLYGNVVQIFSQGDKSSTIPTYFQHSVHSRESYRFNRLENKNEFYTNGRTDTLQIPFITNSDTLLAILQEAFNLPIEAKELEPLPYQYLYGKPTDSLYCYMMHNSDNFMAEQINLMASGLQSDTLNGQAARDQLLQNALSGLRQKPRWVDGSGLSRYNLFTPESMVFVLNELYLNYDKKRLFDWFPAGGRSGTLKNWFSKPEAAYIFAKSGTLSNNYCLSGYLVTKKNKVLIFSFMNNHFRQPTARVKEEMQRLLELLSAAY